MSRVARLALVVPRYSTGLSPNEKNQAPLGPGSCRCIRRRKRAKVELPGPRAAFETATWSLLKTYPARPYAYPSHELPKNQGSGVKVSKRCKGANVRGTESGVESAGSPDSWPSPLLAITVHPEAWKVADEHSDMGNQGMATDGTQGRQAPPWRERGGSKRGTQVAGGIPGRTTFRLTKRQLFHHTLEAQLRAEPRVVVRRIRSKSMHPHCSTEVLQALRGAKPAEPCRAREMNWLLQQGRFVG